MSLSRLNSDFFKKNMMSVHGKIYFQGRYKGGPLGLLCCDVKKIGRKFVQCLLRENGMGRFI